MTPATPPRNILLIKPSAIGDVVHALPVLNLFRRQWPAAKISWLVTPACAGILHGHPQLDEVILFQRKQLASWWWHPRTTLELHRFYTDLRRRAFDLVVDLQGLFRSGYTAWRTRAARRIGFASAREGAPLFYTDKVEADTRREHAVDRYLKVATALGCTADRVEFIFPTDDADRAVVAAMLPGRSYAVLLPGTNWMTKRWPIEHFAATARVLRSRFNLEPILAGGPGDSSLADQVEGLNLCGKTNLRQLVALLEGASLVIANDSGPMHIAAALGKPMVSPFGPTDPRRTGPYRREDAVLRLDLPCSPCLSRRCSHQSCLKWLEPALILRAAEEQLARPIHASGRGEFLPISYRP